MPANTSAGWPYVLPTDNVADYPVTSQALATFAEAHTPFALAAFTFSMSVGSLASYDRVVNFPAGLFTQVPMITLAKSGGANTTKWMPGVVTPTAASVTIRALTVDASTGNAAATLTVWLIAMQATAGSGPTPGVTFLEQEIDLSQEEDPDAVRAILAEISAAETAALAALSASFEGAEHA